MKSISAIPAVLFMLVVAASSQNLLNRPRCIQVTGTIKCPFAWMDHEATIELLDRDSVGWDWVDALNKDDLMELVHQ